MTKQFGAECKCKTPGPVVFGGVLSFASLVLPLLLCYFTMAEVFIQHPRALKHRLLCFLLNRFFLRVGQESSFAVRD